MMMHYRAAFLLSILLTLGLLPFTATFRAVVPTTATGIRRPAAFSLWKAAPSDGEANSRVAGRLRSTTEALDHDTTEAGSRKKDKVTTEARELLDAFEARERGESRYDLFVAQVAPSVR
jgi:hypothetical protein